MESVKNPFTKEGGTMNYTKAFSFMFEDQNWIVKIILGAIFNLLTLVLVGIPFIFGYLLEVAKNSAEGKEIPLPEWDNLGEKFVRGLVYLIILIIYSIPGMILVFIPCVKFCLGPLYFLALGFILPYITVRYAQTGSFEECFRFNQIIDFTKNNVNNLIMVVLLTIALQIIAAFGTLALVVGVFFTMFWAHLAIFYLYGKVVRAAAEGETGEEVPKTSPTVS
jgi:hypothetical protein